MNNFFSEMGTGFSISHPGTWVATLIVLGLLICLLIGLYYSFENPQKGLFASLLMMMSFCSRIIMGFSPTVWASGMRTYYIIYLVAAILVSMLFFEIDKLKLTNKAPIISLVVTIIGIATFLLTVLNKG